MVSLFGVGIGDTVSFAIARNGGTVTLVVAGFYEAPFMGSSMIGMKGFLVSSEDYEAMTGQIRASGIDALAGIAACCACCTLFAAYDIDNYGCPYPVKTAVGYQHSCPFNPVNIAG